MLNSTSTSAEASPSHDTSGLMTPPKGDHNSDSMSSTRKRSISNLSTESESRHQSRTVNISCSQFNNTKSTTNSPSSSAFRSISSHSRATSPSMENIISPILPKTPTKSFSFTSSCIPNPTDHLQVSFPLRLQYHTTSNLCSEGGLVKYHKGIVPNHPKGYYCCLNTELASRQSNLRVVDNSVLLEVYGPIGLLAYIEAVDSAIIRQEVASLENLGLTVILCVDNFMESGKCTTTTQRQLYQFSDDSWNARVCVYTRPTPPMDLSSYGFASASAMASGAYKNDNVEVSMKEDNAGQSVVRPRPLKRSLFHTQSSKESNNLFKRGGNDNDGDDRKKHLKTETMMTCSSSIINSRGALEPRSLFTRNKKKLVAI